MAAISSKSELEILLGKRGLGSTLRGFASRDQASRSDDRVVSGGGEIEVEGPGPACLPHPSLASNFPAAPLDRSRSGRGGGDQREPSGAEPPAKRRAASYAAGGGEALRLRPGTITELVSATAGGLASLALHLATQFSGKIAWLDPADRFDPLAAARAGLALQRLLWVRGGDAVAALRAAQTVIQAGGFSLLVLDFLDCPEPELRQPRSSWFRLLRGLECERRAALLVLAPRPLAGSCADTVLSVRYAAWHWNLQARPVLEGARIQVRVHTARRQLDRRPPSPDAGPVHELTAQVVA